MLEADFDSHHHTARIVLQQNISSSWHSNITIFIPLIILIILIALMFTLQGGWVMLPFAGLDIVVLVAVVYQWFRNTSPIEVISFSDTSVILEKGKHKADQIWQCSRFWFKVKIVYFSWYLPRIYFQFQDDEQEVGAFLNEEEKKQFIANLRKLMPSIETEYS